MHDFIHQRSRISTRDKATLTEFEILEAVKTGNFFGAVECDIHVPDQLKERFSEMAPIFRNAEVTIDQLGPHMQECITAAGTSQKPRRCLIGSLHGDKILLATPLLRWYLLHGLEVTHVHQTIEWEPKKCFTSFVDEVTTARKQGDRDKAYAIIADTMKLLGNSAYGSMIMNRGKHTELHFVEGLDSAVKLVNSKRFRTLEELNEDLFEIELAKRGITMNLPIQIGFFVLSYAKLRMLEFYYDLVDKYIDRSDFELMEMDTDSNYFALSATTLDELVRPEMRDEYEREKTDWFPCSYPQDLATYQKRTPGLFKEEFRGSEMVCLNPKTYVVYDTNTKTTKFSSKGAQKRFVKNPLDTYKDVLLTQQPSSVKNTGFRKKGESIWTYTLSKKSF